MSSSDSDGLDAFLASLRPKKNKEKYKLSSGSLDDFLVDDGHVSFDEDVDGDHSLEYQRESEISDVEEGFSRLNLNLEDERDQSLKASSVQDASSELNGSNLESPRTNQCSQNAGFTTNHSSSPGDYATSDRGMKTDRNVATCELTATSDARIPHAVGNTALGDIKCNRRVAAVVGKKEMCHGRLDELKRCGSYTPRRSTAKSVTKRSVATPKIIFSSSENESDDDLVFSANTKNLGRKIDLLTKDEDSNAPSDPKSRPWYKKSSRILMLSDEEDVGPPSNFKDDPLVSSFGTKSKVPSSPKSSSKKSVKISSDENDSPLSSPNRVMTSRTPLVSSSAKKSSRVLVLSSDDSSDSEIDNDVIYVESDGSDKENFEQNILESPDDSSPESHPERVGKKLDDVFKTPKMLSKKTPKNHRYLLEDEDEEYKPLVARILGAGGSVLKDLKNDSGDLRTRRISEPKPTSKVTTLLVRPPKSCFTEKTKCRTKKKKSDGLPDDLPTNCEKGQGFKRHRNILTKKLYDFFNETVFSNKLPQDMIVEWDKRLTKTAGVTKCSSRTATSVENGVRCINKTYKATISLSEKVLDTLHRLRDTLCHEMCHAAVWLSDNQNDGHGPYWKAWARRATAAHPEMPVVKRCHSYDITYKYQYQCMTCRKIYGRHSKSIKVDKQACGVCRGRLVLLPQKNTDGTPAKPRQANKFAMFVKENYKMIQKSKSVGGVTPKHSDVMKTLSEQFSSLSTKK